MRGPRFRERVTIITGGASGLGRALCHAFAEEGGFVVCPDINLVSAEETAAEIKRKGGKALPIKMDVGNSEEVAKMVEETLKAFNKIDILVNNAGITYRVDLLDTTEEMWDRVMVTNLKGIFLVTKAVVPHMISRSYGKIVNISSINGITGLISTAYTASKAAVIGLTRKLAMEFAPHNINVNSVAPGFIATPINEEFRETPMGKAINKRLPLGYGRIESIVPTVLFLSSEESDYIQGQCIVVDGGLTCCHDIVPEFRTHSRPRSKAKP